MLIKKIPDVSDLVTTTVMNTEISKGESKVPDISGLVTTNALNTKTGEAENKIPDVSGCNAKISDTEKKYFTNFDYKRKYYI